MREVKLEKVRGSRNLEGEGEIEEGRKMSLGKRGREMRQSRHQVLCPSNLSRMGSTHRKMRVEYTLYNFEREEEKMCVFLVIWTPHLSFCHCHAVSPMLMYGRMILPISFPLFCLILRLCLSFFPLSKFKEPDECLSLSLF